VRTVLLMLDETILTETPPLYCCYGRIGRQVSVPISGGHQRRILHGALNVGTGDVRLLVTPDWTQVEHQHFLNMIRAHWRGWNVVLFEDRAGQHTAPRSLRMARLCGLEVRWLPRATPELNAMDTLWRQVKREALGDRPTASIDQSAESACEQILAMGAHDRLRQAGVLSGNFWLTK
jgi:DDE superfamily endonuclease